MMLIDLMTVMFDGELFSDLMFGNRWGEEFDDDDMMMDVFVSASLKMNKLFCDIGYMRNKCQKAKFAQNLVRSSRGVVL